MGPFGDGIDRALISLRSLLHTAWLPGVVSVVLKAFLQFGVLWGWVVLQVVDGGGLRVDLAILGSSLALFKWGLEDDDAVET